MKRKNKRKKLNLKKILIIIIIILMILCIYKTIDFFIKQTGIIEASSQVEEILRVVEKNKHASVSRYIVYGTHLNLEGNMQIAGDNQIKKAEVVAKDVSGEEIAIDSEYTYEDNLLSFSTLKEINTGLNLENLNVIDYYLLLKVEFANNETKYYSLSNDTEYGNIEYYTLTRNNTNNKININFGTLENIPVFRLNISTVNELPEDVYDVVVDPGHGGNDSGAISGKYIESDIVLDCAKRLKTELEAIGLKVLLTRDGTESEEDYTTYNIYDEDGRVTMANESHAKILISLHMNSNEEYISEGGIEVYDAPNSDLTLAKLLADNIVEVANTQYSQNESDKELEGVYVRTIELDEYINNRNSSSNNYHGIFDSIPYLYIIREIGGIATGAYVDGSNSNYSANKYRNSNVGVEGYLIELGYINVREDLNHLLRNEDLYVKGIVNSINTFYEIEQK